MPTLKNREIVVSPIIFNHQPNGEIKVLLVQYHEEDREDFSPVWHIPQIGVNFGQSPNEALTQGIEQRLNIQGTVLGILSCDSSTYKTYNATVHKIRIIYLINQINQTEESIIAFNQIYKECKWIKKEDIELNNIAREDKEILKMSFDYDKLFLGDCYD